MLRLCARHLFCAAFRCSKGSPWGGGAAALLRRPRARSRSGIPAHHSARSYPELRPCLTTLYSSFTLSDEKRYCYVTRPCVPHASESESTMFHLRGCVRGLSKFTLQRGPKRDDELRALNELLHGIKAGVDGADVSQRPTYPLPQQPPTPCIATLKLLHVTPSLRSPGWNLTLVEVTLQGTPSTQTRQGPLSPDMMHTTHIQQ